MAERDLTVDRAWQGVVTEWHESGISFDAGRGYRSTVIEVPVDQLFDAVEQHMEGRADVTER